MDKLVFGLLHQPSGSTGNARLRELTIAWSRYGYHGTIIEADDINQLLDQASAAGYRYCLIQQTGHVIDEQWSPPHWNRPSFHGALHRWMDEQDFFVTGEWVIDSNGCYGLKNDSLLINLQYYDSFGQPEFGQPEAQSHNLMKADQLIQPDNCPGRQLVTGDGQLQFRPEISGWRFIDISLRHNLPILAFPKAINQGRLNLNGVGSHQASHFQKYVGQPINGFADDSQLTDDQKLFLEGIIAQTRHAQRGVFLWNIESYQDLQPAAADQPLDAVCTVAAGFKTNRILHQYGFTDTTRVIFFDYSRQALNIRRQMVNEWDGEDYPSYIRHLFDTNPHPETFYQLWQNVTPENVDWSDMEHFWQLELDKWGGAPAFKQHWQAYRQLPHQYVSCNLLTEPQRLLEQIRPYQNLYLWWSNAFFTVNSNWFYSNAERRQMYNRWIHALADHNPTAQINGADYNNVAVNGITAAEYLEQFNARPCNELQPKQRHQIGIHF